MDPALMARRGMFSWAPLWPAQHDRPPHSLSRHAKDRLAVRCALDEARLLSLLDGGAFVRIASETRWFQGTGQMMQYDFRLVWSEVDEAPVLAVTEVGGSIVCTVLLRPQMRRHLKVATEQASPLCEARARAAREGTPVWRDHEVVVSWLDADGRARRRSLEVAKLPDLLNGPGPDDSRLRALAESVAGGQRNVFAVLRHRKHPAQVAQEVALA